jgi:hypothetical protein
MTEILVLMAIIVVSVLIALYLQATVVANLPAIKA